VLEVGPATGYVTEALKERGCRVVAIEIDPVAAELAAGFCERMLIGDIETLDLDRLLKGELFDVIMFGDVLEHLVDPGRVLHDVGRFLKPSGRLVVSVPNVAHGSIRLGLLNGRFDYVDTGLLDRTHLRFFTKDSFEALLRTAGFEIEEFRRVLIDPFSAEVPLQEAAYLPEMVRALREDIEATTYQMVVSARRLKVRRKATPPPQAANGLPDVVRVLLDKQKEIVAPEALIAREHRSLGYRLLKLPRAVALLVCPPASLRGRAYARVLSLFDRLSGAG